MLGVPFGRWGWWSGHLAGLCVLMLLAGPASAAPDATESVRATTRTLLAKLDEVQPLFKSDPDRFYREVEAALGPHVDFEGFSRGVMAKNYRRASPEQRTKFVAKFRTSLIRTYARALVEFDNQRVDVKAGKPSKRPNRATVRLEVHGARGVIYPVDYTVALKNDEWKLLNVTIDGINIGLQFRSQFADAMRKNRNDIDAVIAGWDVAGD